VYDPNGFTGEHLYLDANVFIYGVEGFKPYDKFLRAFFELIDNGQIRATTSEITLAEVLVAPIRDTRQDLAAIYEEMLSSAGPINVLPAGREILIESAAIRARSSAKPLDAIHIATAGSARASFFISDDRRLNPAPIKKVTLAELVSA